MSDIIKRAKEVEEYCIKVNDFEDVRKIAQALAEETWEYSAQAKRGDNWETSTNSETHLEEWWQDKTDAEAAAARMQEQGHTTRIVERRVSPPQITQ